MYQYFLQIDPADPNPDTVKVQLAKEFKKYFIDPDTMENDILEKMKLLKNMKDFLLI